MVKNIICDCLALDLDEIDENNTLTELGAESIDLLDLEFRIKKQMDVDVSEFLTSETKISELVDFCEQKLV